MPSLNKVMLIGRLTRDPEMKYTPNGQPVTELGLATNRYWSDREGNRQEQTEFHNIVVWNLGRRNLAEIIAQNTRKGALVYIEGRLQTRSWEGTDGQKRSRTEVIAENFEFLDTRSSQTGGGDPYGGNAYGGNGGPQPGPAAAPSTPSGEPPVRDVDPDEIPF
jgi:single-strand DNA-binding protein